MRVARGQVLHCSRMRRAQPPTLSRPDAQHLCFNGERYKGRYTIAKHFHDLMRQVWRGTQRLQGWHGPHLILQLRAMGTAGQPLCCKS